MNFIRLVISVLLLARTAVGNVPPELPDHDRLVAYLVRYGYVPENRLITEASLARSVRRMQNFLGAPASGKLDDATRAILRTPRCGDRDVQTTTLGGGGGGGGGGGRKKRSTSGRRWSMSTVTYYYDRKSGSLDAGRVKQEIRLALEKWSAVAGIDFAEAPSRSQAKIVVDFARREHGDSSPFDGSGGVLAHAYYPANGDVHFDDDERFMLLGENSYGHSFFKVAIHELGHSLGLVHSNVRGSIMFPFLMTSTPNDLHADDITKIRSLYGLRPRNEATTPYFPLRPALTIRPRNDDAGNTDGPCGQRGPIQAFVHDNDNVTFALYGSRAFRIENYHVRQSTPLPFSLSDVDAVLNSELASWEFTTSWQRFSNTIYFFKGNLVYKSHSRSLSGAIVSKVSRIAEEFPGLPDGINAAIIYPVNNLWYFFKGNSYYRVSNRFTRQVDSGYPRSIDVWRMGRNIRSVYTHTNNRIYFFYNDDTYARMSATEIGMDVDTALPYPRPVRRWWFNCQTTAAQVQAGDQQQLNPSGLGEHGEPGNQNEFGESGTSRPEGSASACAIALVVLLALAGRRMFPLLD